MRQFHFEGHSLLAFKISEICTIGQIHSESTSQGHLKVKDIQEKKRTLFLSFNTTLIINIYHSIINITDSFCLVQGIFQPSIPLTHTDAKHNYVSIIHINHIFHQCYLTKQDKCPPRKTTQSVTKKVESRKSRKKTIYGL